MVINRRGINLQQIFKHFLFRDITDLRLALQIAFEFFAFFRGVAVGVGLILMENVVGNIVVGIESVVSIYLIINQLANIILPAAVYR